MTKYQIRTTEYERTHGKAPKGRGFWGFIIKGHDIESNVNVTKDYNTGETILWVPGSFTLTEAKKRACVMLAANAVPNTVQIQVAP